MTRREKYILFEAIADVTFGCTLATDNDAASGLQAELYKRGHLDAAYIMERDFFAGKRTPEYCGWQELAQEFEQYMFDERDEYERVTDMGLDFIEAVEHRNGFGDD